MPISDNFNGAAKSPIHTVAVELSQRRSVLITAASARAGVLALILCAGLMPGAGLTRAPQPQLDSDAALLNAGVTALSAGDARTAIAPLSNLASRQTGNTAVQAMLALAYQRAERGNPENAELAMVGYDLALRADPGNGLAAGLAGRLAFDRGRYSEAAEFYARAVLADPAADGALLGLAAASYMAGDVSMASLAASRAEQTAAKPETRRAALRLAMLANGALSQTAAARTAYRALEALAPAEATTAAVRLAQLEQTSAVDAAVAGESLPDGGGAIAAGDSPDQVSVDMAIVLSQNTQRERIGLNLLDGLALNYSYGNQFQRTRQSAPGFDPAVTSQRVITQAIGVPQLTYNLNIFNRGGQFYNVVARPSLTAFRGETSEFFIGRSVKVAVSGVNTAALEQIDIGIEMTVTPIEITPDGTRVRIAATRSFLTADPAGNFTEALTTFRQRVAATAQIRFGETLILSGLSEQVDDNTFSKTPVLGDLPLVQNLFRQKNTTRRQDAALILITPSRVGRIVGRPFMRSDSLARISEIWTRVIDPSANAASVAAQLSKPRRFSRMRVGDARLTWPDPDGEMGKVLAGLLAQGGLDRAGLEARP